MDANEEDKVLATDSISVGCGLKMKNRKKYRQKKQVWVNEWLKQHS